ncbi:MAG TPA: hypothetical protein VKI17_04920 [Gemmataceae bacterium]|nr:hypothetical protein [Gemmataceae bacterium]
MLWPSRRSRWLRVAHRFCASVILLAYIATAIGFPMRVFQAKDGSQPFICQNHVCRCHNAQDCWQHCCCYSAQEKLAWAQEQHVEPPAYAETAKPRGWHNLRRRDRDLQRESGASASSEDAVAERASACKNGCCSGHQPPAQSNRDDNRNKRQNDEGSGAAPTVSVLKCRCPSTTWVSTGAIVIASPAFAWNLFFLAGEKLLPSNQDCLSYLSIPPDPPPRCL